MRGQKKGFLIEELAMKGIWKGEREMGELLMDEVGVDDLQKGNFG